MSTRGQATAIHDDGGDVPLDTCGIEKMSPQMEVVVFVSRSDPYVQG